MSGAERLVVVKVGGSLLDWPPLPDRLARWMDARRDRGERLVLIVGGGGAADWVRALDRVHRLGDDAAHALAVRSLDLTARALAAIVPGVSVAETVAAMEDVWKAGSVPALAPRLTLEEDDRTSPTPLPRTWDSTTDAIAARIARRLGASGLVLLKSTSVPEGTSCAQAAERGVVDRQFPEEARGIGSVVLVDLRGGVEVRLRGEERSASPRPLGERDAAERPGEG